MNVDSMKWGEFKICDLFEIVGTYTTHPRELMPNGRTPRITCAATNNGLDNTYQNVATEKGGVLSVDSATIGYIAYQENDFIATDHIEKIMLKNGKTMNRYVGLFIKQCIDNAVLQKYGYGYKFSQTRIKKQIIKLPIDSKGNPNYAFMESFMKNLEQKHLRKIIKYYKNKLLDSNGRGGVIFATHLILLNLHFAIPILYPAILIFYRVIPIFCLVILSKAKYPKDITNNPTLLQQSKTLQLSLRVA